MGWRARGGIVMGVMGGALAWVGACATEYGGTLGPADAASEASDVPEAGEGNPTDASDDAFASDSADAGGDAAPLVDAGAVDAASVENFCRPMPQAVFCWDFSGADAPPRYGWSSVTAQGGTVAVEGTVDTAERKLSASVASSATSPSAALNEDLAFVIPNGETLKLTFKFQVPVVGTYAEIAVLSLNGIEYGLAVLGNCIGSQGCILENDLPGRPSSAIHVAIDPAVTYLGTVTLTRQSDGGWGSTLAVNGQAIAQRSTGALPTGTPATPLRLTVGAAFAGNTGTTTQVFIDDILLVASP